MGAGEAHTAAADAAQDKALPKRMPGLLCPLRIDRGISVLEIGAGRGDLTEALALLGAEVLALEADEDLARDAGQRSVRAHGAHVMHSTLDEWRSRSGAGDTTFDLVIHRQPRDAAARPTAAAREVVDAAAELLRPSGALVLAVQNPWALGRLLRGLGAGEGPGPAALRGTLAAAGLVRQRWLLPYPDHHDPQVIVDGALLGHAVGATLVKWLVREPVRRHVGGRPLLTDPIEAFQAAVDADLAGDVAESFLVVASRAGSMDADLTRDGRLWTVPRPDLDFTWQRSQELLQIGGRWLLHPRETYQAEMAGPLSLEPLTIDLPLGRSGEDVLVEALTDIGGEPAAAASVLAAWWRAAEQAYSTSDPGRRPLDLRPRRFVVGEDGVWSFVPPDLVSRFGLPLECLVFGALADTISVAVLPRGWLLGIDPSATVAEATRLLLGSIGIECGDEHEYLWVSLKTDTRVRTASDPAERDEVRREVRDVLGEVVGARLTELPLRQLVWSGLQTPALTAVAARWPEQAQAAAERSPS